MGSTAGLIVAITKRRASAQHTQLRRQAAPPFQHSSTCVEGGRGKGEPVRAFSMYVAEEGGRVHLAQVLLHELRPNDPDEGGGRVVGDGLGQHRFAGAGDAVQEDAARRVDADLLVQLMVRQRQLHRLPDLLLLDVQPADVLHATRTPLTQAAAESIDAGPFHSCFTDDAGHSACAEA